MASGRSGTGWGGAANLLTLVPRGTAIGRYIVVGVAGHGGMELLASLSKYLRKFEPTRKQGDSP